MDALTRSKDTFRGLLESAPDAMVIVDQSGEIVLVNAQTEQVFGYRREELVGERVEMLVPDRCREHHRCTREGYSNAPHRRAMEAGLELFGQRKDGSEFPVEISLSPLKTEAGTLVSSAIRDITARKRVESQLAEARAAMEASRLKSEFLTNMSHEMHTPMNGVIGMTDLLRDTALNPVQRDFADKLAASSEALLALITDLLEFSTIDAGSVELNPTAFDLRRVVEEAYEPFAREARTKGLDVTCRVDAELPTAVCGDHARVRQILSALLSNATKFTAAGEVTLRVSNLGGNLVHFAVSDTGLGIDEEWASRLFEAFVQADMSASRRYGGAGLGLAISRELVERMGGEIGAGPREGGGSVFWFRVVLPEVAGAA